MNAIQQVANNAANAAAVIEHRDPGARRTEADLSTAQYGEHWVTLQDAALALVRVSWEEHGAEVMAVQLNDAWLNPHDVLLPSTINCMQAELDAMTSEDPRIAERDWIVA